jgi:hypothetical protein
MLQKCFLRKSLSLSSYLLEGTDRSYPKLENVYIPEGIRQKCILTVSKHEGLIVQLHNTRPDSEVCEE